MRTKVITSLFVAALMFCACEAKSEEEVTTPVKVSLVSDVSAIAPGKPFRVGVFFEMIPHWHIYWKNSGDTGLPTKVSFKLPEGFTSNKLNWPVPQVYTRAGDITDYGYEDSLFLYSQVNAPEDLKTGSEIVLSAEVTWVSCEEICIPGKEELTLNLPVSGTQQQVNTSLFSEWKSRMTVPESGKKNPFRIKIRSTEKDKASKIITLTLQSDNPVSVTGLYPVPGDTLSVSDITIDETDEGRKTDIKLEVRALSGLDLKDSHLETLIVYKDTDGKRSGLRFSIPIGN